MSQIIMTDIRVWFEQTTQLTRKYACFNPAAYNRKRRVDEDHSFTKWHMQQSSIGLFLV